MLLLVAVAVLLYRIGGDLLRDHVGLEHPITPPAKRGRLRIATWNLENFPHEDQDPALLGERLRDLDADVIALQEIRNAEALTALLPGREIHLSRRGGRSGQKLGVAVDPTTVEVVGSPTEHAELSLGGKLRPALSVYLRARAGGPDLHVVVVHLKAFDDGIEIRKKQWAELVDLVEQITFAPPNDTDVIVLGDFNTTGPPNKETIDELVEVDATLGKVGLERLETPQGCTAYWEGTRRDAWKEASLLDLVYVKDLREARDEKLEAFAFGPCARHACEAFRSTPAYPELDFAMLSDHCPLVLDLPTGRDDDPPDAGASSAQTP